MISRILKLKSTTPLKNENGLAPSPFSFNYLKFWRLSPFLCRELFSQICWKNFFIYYNMIKESRKKVTGEKHKPPAGLNISIGG